MNLFESARDRNFNTYELPLLDYTESLARQGMQQRLYLA
jgi:hypothetical protein